MRLVRLGAVAAMMAFSITPAIASVQSVERTVHWGTGSQHLAQSNASFQVPSGSRMVTGNDAQQLDEAINGTDSSTTEGYVQIENGGSLYLEYNDGGYVTTDDFSQINPDDMMDSMKKATESENDERKSHGIKALYIDGWVLKPTFDKKSVSARFVVADHLEDGTKLVNAVALVLGRHGYERLTLATDPANTAQLLAELDRLTKAYHYDTGSRFSDFVTGDKVAGIGIAALVGTAAGVTLAKTIGFGAIGALLVKFWFVILGAIAALFSRIRKLFGGKKNPQQVAAVMPQSSPFENPPPPPPAIT